MLINAQAELLWLEKIPWPVPVVDDKGRVNQDPGIWRTALVEALKLITTRCDPTLIEAVCVDGTSGTLLALDAKGDPLGPALMYSDRGSPDSNNFLHSFLTTHHLMGATALAKALTLSRLYAHCAAIRTQADWISGWLMNNFAYSDSNNCLKLGYNVVTQKWPAWFANLPRLDELLPQVVSPGTVLGRVDPKLAQTFGFNKTLQVVAGTTDSTAAFLATGAQTSGDAVTCLGSTLVLKILSEQPIFEASYGVYAHKIFDHWLVGGASNTGGAVLQRFFSAAELSAFSEQIKPDQPTGLDYYPLNQIGERFPIADANFAPRLSPRPKDPAVFLQGLLEGIARIERDGYSLLAKLGAPPVKRILTTGGGAGNLAWQKIREHLNPSVEFVQAQQTEAAYGAALLARRGASRTG